MRSSQPQTSVPLADVQSTPLTRIPTVIRWTGLARSTIYRLIAEQKVPTPVVLATQARYKSSDECIYLQRFHNMPASPGAAMQRTQALALLKQRGVTRLSRFHKASVTAMTISRRERAGDIVRLARSL